MQAHYTETNWQTAVQVNDYSSYTSSSVLFYTVPSLAISSTWSFNAFKSPDTDACEDRTVIIYLKQGSFPVINPLNESFPEFFNILRTDLHSFSVLTDNEVVDYRVDSPLPGSWYGLAYLGDYIDDSITQKGLGTDCSYYLGVVHVVEALENVQEIPTSDPVLINATQDNFKVYRFHCTDQTWQYTVIITECLVGNETISPCPVQLSTRALTLPLFDNHSNTINCSEHTECILTVMSPVTMNWHYLIAQSLTDTDVQLTLAVYLRACTVGMPPFDSNHTDSGLINITLDTTTLSDPLMTTQRLPDSMMTTQRLPDSMMTTQPSLDRVMTTQPLPDPVMTTQHPPVDNKPLYREVDTQYAENLLQSVDPAVRLYDSLTIMTDRQSHMVNSEEMDSHNVSSNWCFIFPQLGRFETPTKIFQVEFIAAIYSIPVRISLFVRETEPLVLHFKILPGVDIGGTLSYVLQIDTSFLNNSNQIVEIQSCIQRLGLPVSEAGVSCHMESYVNVSSGGELTKKIYYPYPEPGNWYISLQAQCSTNDSLQEPVACSQAGLVAITSVVLNPCVDSGCGEYGNCITYYSRHHRYSTCSCFAGYRGYGCTDGSKAVTDSIQLASTLLLTLSNVLFLPAIAISLYRRFFPEALSFTYTMFFSTFYHACDSNSKYTYCLLPYNVLSYCDFFGAILSVWMTFMALSRLREQLRSFLFLLAGLVIAMFVTWDKHSLLTFAIPALGGLVIMIISWSHMCYERRDCYPSRKRWVLFLVPGVVIAGVGLVTYAFFETESNYWYTHSCWHACMALCIVFFLPPHKYNKPVKFSRADSTDTSVTLVKSIASLSLPLTTRNGTVVHSAVEPVADAELTSL